MRRWASNVLPLRGEVEAEVEAVAGGGLGHLRLHLARLVDAHAVLAREVLGAVALALGRRVRVELEAAPGHRDLVASARSAASAASKRRLPT